MGPRTCRPHRQRLLQVACLPWLHSPSSRQAVGGGAESSVSASRVSRPVAEIAHAAPPLGGAEERRRDLGVVVGGPGRTRDQTFSLVNRSRRPVRLLRAINAKSCCGEVLSLSPTVIRPGEAASLAVRIKLGQTIGSLSHRALVETDHPDAPSLEFWTLADVRPRARIEESAEPSTRLFPGMEASRGFTLVALGTATDPPMALDDAAIRSPLPIKWVGPAADEPLDGGVIQRTRPFEVGLKAGVAVGPRIDEIRFVVGDEVLLNHVFRWEVSPAIRATPGGIVAPATAEVHTVKILLSAQDGRPFRVTGVGPKPEGVEVKSAVAKPAKAHTILVVITPGAARVGKAVIQTDHPSQSTVDVAIYAPGPAVAEVKP